MEKCFSLLSFSPFICPESDLRYTTQNQAVHCVGGGGGGGGKWCCGVGKADWQTEFFFMLLTSMLNCKATIENLRVICYVK